LPFPAARLALSLPSAARIRVGAPVAADQALEGGGDGAGQGQEPQALGLGVDGGGGGGAQGRKAVDGHGVAERGGLDQQVAAVESACEHVEGGGQVPALRLAVDAAGGGERLEPAEG